jgi:hypothetical protein
LLKSGEFKPKGFWKRLGIYLVARHWRQAGMRHKMPSLKAQVLNYPNETEFNILNRSNWFCTNGHMKLKDSVVADLLECLRAGEQIENVEFWYNGKNELKGLRLYYPLTVE